MRPSHSSSKSPAPSEDLWQWAERHETTPPENAKEPALSPSSTPRMVSALLSRLRDALFRS